MDYGDIHTPRLEGGSIPIESCTMADGTSGFRYGKSGKCYKERAEAEKQAAAIHASGFMEKSMQVNKFDMMGGGESSPDLDMAFNRLQDEAEGSGRYASMAESAKDPDLKKLLLDLSTEELGHAKRLTDYIEAHKPTETEKSAPVRLICEIAKVADNVVYAIVLKAGVEDLQGDVMDAADIREAMHDYMAQYRAINLNHTPGDIDACPVECWQADAPGKLGERTYGPGDWLMGTRINDPVVLQGVLSGKYRSYSIEGVGVREPIGA